MSLRLHLTSNSIFWERAAILAMLSAAARAGPDIDGTLRVTAPPLLLPPKLLLCLLSTAITAGRPGGAVESEAAENAESPPPP